MNLSNIGLGAVLVVVLAGCASQGALQQGRPELNSGKSNAKIASAARVGSDLRKPYAQKAKGRERMEYLHARNEFGIVPDDGAANAYAAREALVRAKGETAKLAGVGSTSWTNLGPGNVAGRTRMLVVHPTNANVLWAGTARGGVWKSSDAGENWKPLTDAIASNAIATLVIDPNNADTLYAGTGEYSGRRGAGIYVTRDGGDSWSQLPATNAVANNSFRFVNRIALSKQVSGLMLVATNDGIFRSTDSGVSFSKPLALTGYRKADGNGGDGAIDLKQDPNRPARFIAGLFDGSVVISEDNGASWERSPVITADLEPRRVEIAFSNGEANVLYASVDMNEGEIYRSADGGRSWALRATPKHLKKQGDYDNAIWVHPTQSNIILIGGVDLYRSTNGGGIFVGFDQAQSAKGSNGFGANAHSDHHAFVPAAQFGISNQKIYNVNDGGVWVMDDVTAAQFKPEGQWRNINNGLVATQIYAHAADPARGVVIIGTQDTGLVGYRFNRDAFNTWQEYALGGDYFTPQLDPTSDYGYATVYNLLVQRFRGDAVDQVGPTRTRLCDGIPDAPNASGRCTSNADNEKANFDAGILLDPNNPLRLYAGGNSLWVTTNPRDANVIWKSAKSPSTAAGGDNYISSMAVRNGNGNEMWVGHNNGELYRTSNALAADPTWQQVTGLPARLVESVVFDRFDPKVVYVLFGGFAAGNLQVSRDGGTTWAALGAGRLPEASFASLSQHPLRRDWLYLGTFAGLFTSLDGGLTWSTTNDGPAAASILTQSWLNDSTLLVSTYGRGMWQASVDANARKVRVYELYNKSINHYFRTQNLEEATFLSTVLTGDARWDLTGDEFKAWAANQDDGSAQPVCRFYGDPKIGPNSHFYLVGRDNCVAFEAQESKIPKGTQRWNLESTEFSVNVPTPAGCPASAPVAIYRIYNNGFARGDSHHRYTTQPAEIARLTALGWTSEGVVMCGLS